MKEKIQGKTSQNRLTRKCFTTFENKFEVTGKFIKGLINDKRRLAYQPLGENNCMISVLF